jgi:hypothetical protein
MSSQETKWQRVRGSRSEPFAPLRVFRSGSRSANRAGDQENAGRLIFRAAENEGPQAH